MKRGILAAGIAIDLKNETITEQSIQNWLDKHPDYNKLAKARNWTAKTLKKIVIQYVTFIKVKYVH